MVTKALLVRLEIKSGKDEEAEQFLQSALPDVVMPQMGGLELSKKLLKTNAQIRVLFTSGYTENSKIKYELINTSANFIQKPFTPESLANKVREKLDDK